CPLVLWLEGVGDQLLVECDRRVLHVYDRGRQVPTQSRGGSILPRPRPSGSTQARCAVDCRQAIGMHKRIRPPSRKGKFKSTRGSRSRTAARATDLHARLVDRLGNREATRFLQIGSEVAVGLKVETSGTETTLTLPGYFDQPAHRVRLRVDDPSLK